jgi:hypothetical protein
VTTEEREAAADAILASVDLEPLAQALADLLADVCEQEQGQEKAS